MVKKKRIDNVVNDYLNGKIKIKGSFIFWDDLKFLPKNSINKISNLWHMIQEKKKKDGNLQRSS